MGVGVVEADADAELDAVSDEGAETVCSAVPEVVIDATERALSLPLRGVLVPGAAVPDLVAQTDVVLESLANGVTDADGETHGDGDCLADSDGDALVDFAFDDRAEDDGVLDTLDDPDMAAGVAVITLALATALPLELTLAHTEILPLLVAFAVVDGDDETDAVPRIERDRDGDVVAVGEPRMDLDDEECDDGVCETLGDTLVRALAETVMDATRVALSASLTDTDCETLTPADALSERLDVESTDAEADTRALEDAAALGDAVGDIDGDEVAELVPVDDVDTLVLADDVFSTLEERDSAADKDADVVGEGDLDTRTETLGDGVPTGETDDLTDDDGDVEGRDDELGRGDTDAEDESTRDSVARALHVAGAFDADGDAV